VPYSLFEMLAVATVLKTRLSLDCMTIDPQSLCSQKGPDRQ